MFRISFILITGLFIILLSGCASSPPGLVTEPGSAQGQQASTDDDLDALFIDMHGRSLDAIERIENEGGNEDLIIELKSIVQIAEESYLKGNPLLAVRLLKEAELLSRQNPR